jgi:opacity protein-like surface antigen
MKKQNWLANTVLTITTLGMACSASADIPGWYIGGALGHSTIRSPSKNLFGTETAPIGTQINETANQFEIGGIGGQALVGYNLNQFFGLECAYSRISDSVYKTEQDKIDNNNNNTLLGSSSATLRYKSSSLAVMAKGSWFISRGLALFLKIGIAEVMQTIDFTNPTSNPTISFDGMTIATPNIGSHTHYRPRPIYALGFGVKINKKMMLNFAWTQIFKKGNIKADQDTILGNSLIAVELTYHIDT